MMFKKRQKLNISHLKVEFIVQGGQVLDHAGGVVAHSAYLLATQVAGRQGWESFPEILPDEATLLQDRHLRMLFKLHSLPFFDLFFVFLVLIAVVAVVCLELCVIIILFKDLSLIFLFKMVIFLDISELLEFY